MTIPLITIGLIFGTTFLMRKARKKISIANYIFVLLGGIVTFLFEPLIFTFYTNGSVDGGAIQIISTISGIYFIAWSITRLVKYKKETRILSGND